MRQWASSRRRTATGLAVTERIMDDQAHHLETALQRLVDDGVVSPAQAAAMLRAVVGTRRGRGNWLVEVAGYVGGALLLAGVATFVALSWQDYDRVVWVALGAVVTLALLASGLLIAGDQTALGRWVGVTMGTGGRRGGAPSMLRRRLAGVLLGMSAVAGAITVGISTDHQPDYLAPAVATAIAAAGYALLRTVPGVLVTATGSLITAFTVIEEFDDANAPVSLGGFVLVALGVLWAALGLGGLVVPRSVALGIGSAIGLIGGQYVLSATGSNGVAYALTAAVALACLAVYRVAPSAVLLVAGVVGISLVVPEIVWEVTDGAGGAATILIVSGAALLGASGVGLRLRSRTSHHPIGGPSAEPFGVAPR
jgi:hypothetical protein